MDAPREAGEKGRGGRSNSEQIASSSLPLSPHAGCAPRRAPCVQRYAAYEVAQTTTAGSPLREAQTCDYGFLLQGLLVLRVERIHSSRRNDNASWFCCVLHFISDIAEVLSVPNEAQKR